jgi:hypothetical protein
MWGYEYSRYSTPEKAQAALAPAVAPFEKIPFAQGVVLITPGPNSPGDLMAWYVKKGWLGWRVRVNSAASLHLSPQNYNVDFQSFVIDGETFVWGTVMVPSREVVFEHDGHTYRAPIEHLTVWHMTLPFEISTFPHSEWTLVLADGKTVPLFK